MAERRYRAAFAFTSTLKGTLCHVALTITAARVPGQAAWTIQYSLSRTDPDRQSGPRHMDPFSFDHTGSDAEWKEALIRAVLTRMTHELYVDRAEDFRLSQSEWTKFDS